MTVQRIDYEANDEQSIRITGMEGIVRGCGLVAKVEVPGGRDLQIYSVTCPSYVPSMRRLWVHGTRWGNHGDSVYLGDDFEDVCKALDAFNAKSDRVKEAPCAAVMSAVLTVRLDKGTAWLCVDSKGVSLDGLDHVSPAEWRRIRDAVDAALALAGKGAPQ